MPVGINSVSTSMCHLTVIFLAVGYANLIKSGCMYKSLPIPKRLFIYQQKLLKKLRKVVYL